MIGYCDILAPSSYQIACRALIISCQISDRVDASFVDFSGRTMALFSVAVGILSSVADLATSQQQAKSIHFKNIFI